MRENFPPNKQREKSALQEIEQTRVFPMFHPAGTLDAYGRLSAGTSERKGSMNNEANSTGPGAEYPRLLILVPFILINQAGLIEKQIVWALCIFAVVVAVGRWSAARGWVSVLKPPPHLLAAGALLLVSNAALVIAYRIFQETKMGKGIASGAAYEMNEASWLWLLPTLCALAILLPCLREDGKLLVQRRWFPVILFSDGKHGAPF